MDGQTVDPSVLQTTIVPPSEVEGGVVGFRNVSQATLTWRLGFCRLNDHPNMEPGYIIYSHDTEWLNEFGIEYSSMNLPCWDMTSTALDMELEPGEGILLRHGFDFTGDGCETFRFKVIQDGAYIDSIDVEYCRETLDLDELSNQEELVYPNPASAEITVKEGTEYVQIFSALGVLVKEVKLDASQKKGLLINLEIISLQPHFGEIVLY